MKAIKLDRTSVVQILIARGFYASPEAFEQEDERTRERILRACELVLEVNDELYQDEVKFASSLTRSRQRLHAFFLRPGDDRWTSVRAHHWADMVSELATEDPETPVRAAFGDESWIGKVKEIPPSCPWTNPGAKVFDATRECLQILRVCLYTVEGGNYVQAVERCRKVLGEALGL